MAGLRSIVGNQDTPGLHSNFNVDYVVHYKFPPQEKAEAEAGFVQLVEALTKVGFATEVRAGEDSSVLVFVKIANEDYLRSQVFRSRLQDWLYAIRAEAPDKKLDAHFQKEPVSEAERLRTAYLLITQPKNDGGAGIVPRTGQWKYVASIFPLHDYDFNRKWIQEWSTKTFLDDDDLNRIRDKFGEKIAFYFAFLQYYFKFLLFPASFGFGAWLILGKFSWLYVICNCLWSVVFFEYWKHKEVDLAVRWGVRGVSKIQHPRSQFQFEREAQDPVTGEVVKVYSPLKRLQKQLLVLPFAAVCILILGSLYGLCFSIEIFIGEVYNGPLKQYLVFLPTVLLTVFVPMLSGVLNKFAERLTHLENYQTQDAHQSSFLSKVFVINFITSYLPLFLTSFVYVPFGKLLVPYLSFFEVTAQKLANDDKVASTSSFEINTSRLQKQMLYFTVTAQIVNFALETLVPYAKHKAFAKAKEFQDKRNGKEGVNVSNDPPDEAAFLSRVRNEAKLEEYDVTIDYREMVVQFGYLTLFSVSWPLTACSFLVNNWVEARSDAMKIAISSQRPIPWRADSIGAWLNSLGFLSWVGSINSAALVYLFTQDPHGTEGYPYNIKGWALLLSMFFAEHVYLIVQMVVRYVVEKMDSPGLQKERAERFAMRKQVLSESLGQAAEPQAATPGVATGEKITRAALEEEARQFSLKGHGAPEEMFWQRQRGMSETIQIGRGMISKVNPGNKNQTSTTH